MFRFLSSKLHEKKDDYGFWEHVDVLRAYLIRVALVFIVFSFAAFFFKTFLFDTIIIGPLHKEFITYGWFCDLGKWLNLDSFCFESVPIKLINIDLGGQFRWHMIISCMAGFSVTFPYMMWQIWLFIKPALTSKEKRSSRGIFASINFLFFTGFRFGYYIILPLSVIFLANYELSPMISNQITISSYISTTVLLPLSTGIVFELPVMVYFLTYTGLLTPKFLKKNRKYAVVIIMLVAGIITPSTDMFTQLIVAIPLYALYEISIAASGWVVKKVAASEDAIPE